MQSQHGICSGEARYMLDTKEVHLFSNCYMRALCSSRGLAKQAEAQSCQLVSTSWQLKPVVSMASPLLMHRGRCHTAAGQGPLQRMLRASCAQQRRTAHAGQRLELGWSCQLASTSWQLDPLVSTASSLLQQHGRCVALQLGKDLCSKCFM